MIFFLIDQSLTIGVSKNIKIVGLNSIHSKFFHLFIYRSQKVEVLGGTLIAPSLSPNTDGIHVQHSMDVKIIGTNIRSGDDCVSIGPGTRKVLIHGVFCGPGHGIRYVTNDCDYTTKKRLFLTAKIKES